MTPVARFESYRDLYFVSFDRNIVSLSDYLAGAKEYIDLICDQTDAGMNIVPGTQEYSIRANWKLLTENSIDGYHAATTHASYFDYLGKTTDMALGDVATRPAGYGYDLGNGHAVIEYPAPWAGRSRNGFPPGVRKGAPRSMRSTIIWCGVTARSGQNAFRS